MMGHRGKMTSGIEVDVFTGWRRYYRFRPGVIRRVKRGYNKRQRKGARMTAAEWREHGVLSGQDIDAMLDDFERCEQWREVYRIDAEQLMEKKAALEAQLKESKRAMGDRKSVV